MKDNIKAVRLISGEVVVGELEFRDEDKGKVAFKNLSFSIFMTYLIILFVGTTIFDGFKILLYACITTSGSSLIHIKI